MAAYQVFFFLGVARAVLPGVRAVDVAEGVLAAGPHAVKEVAPRPPLVGAADERSVGSDRPLGVGAEALAHGRQGKAPARVFADPPPTAASARSTR